MPPINVRLVVVTVALAGVAVFTYGMLADLVAAGGHESFIAFYRSEAAELFSSYRLSLRGLALAMAMAGSGLLVEALIRGWRKSALRRVLSCADGSTVNDIFYWFLGAFGLVGMIRLVITLGGAAVVYYAVGLLDFDIALVDRIDNVALQYLVAFLVLDFLGYLQHRMAHSWDWWWELHRIHHSAESFNMITAYRTHVLENLPRAVVYGIALSITGNLNAFVFYAALLEFVNLLVHSEIQYKWGWLEEILVTPRNHKVHHSTSPRHHDKNFGFTLILWDRLFGTFYRPREDEEIEIGLEDNPFNKGNPISDLLLAYRNSVRRLFGA
jgi:sterol desaturase/sphingolipid hydroxylase (fatty acid hydroxylase superfamily)